MKVLVVDDSTYSRKALIGQFPEDVLNSALIIQGTDGQQAVDLYKEHQPDVMFLDLTMPKKSGYESLEEIISHDSGALIIVVTADVQQKAQERVTKLGAIGVETKPLRAPRLAEIFNNLNKLKAAKQNSSAPNPVWLSDVLVDALSELINISFGSATAMIADLFDSFATLKVPNIKLIPVLEIESVIFEGHTNMDLYVTTQQFRGNFSGEVVFIMNKQSAQNVHRIVYDAKEVTHGDEAHKSVSEQDILEISNILGSSCISKFVALLNESVMFSPPTIERLDQLLVGLKNSQFSKVIVIGTILEFKDIKIYGELFIMFSDEMFSSLRNALKSFVEEV